MKFQSLLVLSAVQLSLGAVLEQRACPGDSCERAVTGTVKGPAFTSQAKADCSSFLLTTVTPSTTTTTTTTTIPSIATAYTTTTITTFSFIGSPAKRTAAAEIAAPAEALKIREPEAQVTPLAKRQATVIPSLVPTYASACSGTARYATACSCYGISGMTSMAPTPTFTVTATTTSVVSTTTLVVTDAVPSAVCDPNQNYGLQYQQGNVDAATNLIMYYGSNNQDCCHRCYNFGSCVQYLLNPNNGACYVYAVESGTQGNNPPTYFCPSGTDNTHLPNPPSGYSGILVGVGPCGVNS